MLADEIITKEKVVVRQDNVDLVREALRNVQTSDPEVLYDEMIRLLLKRGFSSEVSAKHDLFNRNLIPEKLPKFIKDCDLIDELKKTTIAKRAASLRADLNLRQRALSKVLNVPICIISWVENGKMDNDKAMNYLLDLEMLVLQVKKNPEILASIQSQQVEKETPTKGEIENMDKQTELLKETDNDSHKENDESTQPAKRLNLDMALEILSSKTSKLKQSSELQELQALIDEQNARLAKLESAVELIAVHLARG